jgi:hypothetical protein
MTCGVRSAGIQYGLALTALVGLAGWIPAWGQELPHALPSAQLAKPVALPEPSNPSIVFPEGGFPADVSAPEGGIPASTTKPVPGIPHPEVHPPISEYSPPPSVDPQPYLDGPGVEELYEPSSSPLADYFYLPSYYETPGIGARALADYAPPGYEAREWHDAPGAAEFTPISPPVPVTPEERQKFVTRGLFPGSYLVPGTDTSVRWRGFVRATGIFDFNPIATRDDFVTNSIPVPQQGGQNQNISARFSRIGLDTWTPTPLFEWNVHTFIEGDFFNGPGQAVGGGGNPFRLRFAFVDYGYFRIGQQTTVFMDGNAFPSTVDFAGPRGLANLRRPLARATIPLADNLYWAIGVEQPFSDITTNGLGTNVQEVPDIATHLRYESDFGHVQLSSVVRSIGFQETNGDLTQRVGWGWSASTVFHPWALLIDTDPIRNANPSGLERSRILLQYTSGWGIGRYIQDTAGQGLDGQVDPATGAFDTVYAVGWSASYEHWFTENILSNLTYSAVNVASAPGQPPSTYVGAKYLAASLWWIPIRNMSIGIEYVWGERMNLDEQRANANRINALVQYNF